MTSATHTIDDLLEIMARLRDPDGGCPWDLEQSFATIVPHTIEEAYEVAAAIEDRDLEGLCGELGDLLFQVVFYAQLAREQTLFGFDDVVAGVCAKMVRRHPHVFGGDSVAGTAAQMRAWESQKAAERAARHLSNSARPGAVPPALPQDAAAALPAGLPPDVAAHSVLDGVARALPALSRAFKLQRRAARVGFDWPEMAPVFLKVEEEIAETRDAVAAGDDQKVAEELGDLLFAAVNLARHGGVDPETALRRANAKFERRFRAIEAALAARGKTADQADAAELEALWQQAKRAGGNAD